MTKPILSREKIQQLLAAVGSRKTEEETQIEFTEYDWHRPHYFSSDKLEKLDNFTAKTAGAVAEKFAQLYNSDFTVSVNSITQHFAKELLQQTKDSQQNDCYLAFRTQKDHPCGYLSVSGQTAVIWITQLLGDTESEKDSNRVLSELEESLLVDITSSIVEALSNSNNTYDFLPTKEVIRGQTPLEMQGTEELCKITFGIKKTDLENSSEVHFFIFCNNLAATIEETAQTNKEVSPKDISNAILEHLNKMPFCVKGQLASTHLTLEQIISLVPDDILLLDRKIDESIDLIIQKQTIFRGRPVKSAGNYAVAITDINDK